MLNSLGVNILYVQPKKNIIIIFKKFLKDWTSRGLLNYMYEKKKILQLFQKNFANYLAK